MPKHKTPWSSGFGTAAASRGGMANQIAPCSGGSAMDVTEFDRLTVGIPEEEWTTRPHIRSWVRRNCKIRYVPERTLKALGIELGEDVTLSPISR